MNTAAKATTMKQQLRPALVLLTALSLISGLLYPALIAGIGQTLFAQQVGGSLIVRDGRVVGSALVGQSFADPKNF